MTNLDSILKSEDITLPTKVHLVKAMVSPVVTRVGLWRKLSVEELMLLNCGIGEDSWESLGSIQSILKEISPGCSLEGLMLKLKLQYFIHLMWRVDSLENTLILDGIGGKRRRGWQRMRCHHRLNGREFEWTLGVDNGQEGLAFYNSWGLKESDMTERLKWTELRSRYSYKLDIIWHIFCA